MLKQFLTQRNAVRYLVYYLKALLIVIGMEAYTPTVI
jgi:hypothetical protein